MPKPKPKIFAKLEIGLREHPKWWDLPPGPAKLYVDALMWCREHVEEPSSLDGFIPRSRLNSISKCAAKRSVDALVSARLFDVVPGGWMIHDWADVQETAESIAERRSARQIAGAKGLESRWGGSNSHGKSNGASHSNSHGNTYSEWDP